MLAAQAALRQGTGTRQELPSVAPCARQQLRRHDLRRNPGRPGPRVSRCQPHHMRCSWSLPVCPAPLFRAAPTSTPTPHACPTHDAQTIVESPNAVDSSPEEEATVVIAAPHPGGRLDGAAGGPVQCLTPEGCPVPPPPKEPTAPLRALRRSLLRGIASPRGADTEVGPGWVPGPGPGASGVAAPSPSPLGLGGTPSAPWEPAGPASQPVKANKVSPQGHAS